MALVKFGAGVSEMRGKEGGVVYSRNAFGSYIKTKVSPVNPQTTLQQAQRSLMGNLAQLWKTLSAGNKAAWENAGAQATRINRFGDSTAYTGFSLFMRLNRNLSVIGLDAVETAPVPPEIPVLTLGALIANATGPVLTQAFSPTTPGTGLYIVFYGTPNILGGRKFVKNYYRFLQAQSNPGSSPANIYAAWTAAFGTTLVEDASIYIKAKIIDSATGYDGVPDVASTVVLNS